MLGWLVGLWVVCLLILVQGKGAEDIKGDLNTWVAGWLVGWLVGSWEKAPRTSRATWALGWLVSWLVG